MCRLLCLTLAYFPYHQRRNGYDGYNLPSPGSDTLGKEVKRFPAGDAPPAYKSNFMQQYKHEGEGPGYQAQYAESMNNAPPAPVGGEGGGHHDEYADPSAVEPEAEFLNNLRSGSGKDVGGGWNNDTTDTGMYQAPVKTKSGLKPARRRGDANPPKRAPPPAPQQQLQQQRPQQQQQQQQYEQQYEQHQRGGGGGDGNDPHGHQDFAFPDEECVPQQTPAQRRQGQLDALEENFQRGGGNKNRGGGGGGGGGGGSRRPDPRENIPRRRSPPPQQQERVVAAAATAPGGGSWNTDTAITYESDDDEPIQPNFASQSDYGQPQQPPPQRKQQKQQQQQQRMAPPTGDHSPKPEQMKQARSRLSLLKSKIRSSDEKSLMRSSSSKTMTSEMLQGVGSEVDQGSDDPYAGYFKTEEPTPQPRSAPGQQAGARGRDRAEQSRQEMPSAEPAQKVGSYGSDPWNTPGAYPPGEEAPPPQATPERATREAKPRKGTVPNPARSKSSPARAAAAAPTRAAAEDDPYGDLTYEADADPHARGGAGSRGRAQAAPARTAKPAAVKTKPKAARKPAPQPQPQPSYNDDHYGDDPYGADAYPQQQQQGMGDMAAAAGLPPGVDEFGGPPTDQRQCPNCGRSFNPKPYERHVQLCTKINTKREVYDMTKKRQVGEEQDSRRGAAPKKGKAGRTAAVEAPIKAGKAAKWKQQSDQFRQAMRANRDVEKAIAEGKPLPPPGPATINPDYVQCPNCLRNFSQKAGERHIPQCKNIKAKPSSLKKGAGGTGLKGGSTSTTGNRGRIR